MSSLWDDFLHARACILIEHLMDNGKDYETLLADYERKYGNWAPYNARGYKNMMEEEQ